MNEQDEKLLELYLKDVRKKRIFFLTIVMFLITSILLYGFYAKYKQSSNNIDNSIKEDNENNIINENITDEETMSNIENITTEENKEKVEEATKDNANTISKEENTKQETKDNPKENPQTTTASNENKEKNTKEKPANRDFLFTDGYTMENVIQAAQDYLKASGHAGECIPIKDDEGIYLGMRVTFY